MISYILERTQFDKNSLSFITVFILFLMTYVGLVVGANKGDFLNLAALGGIFGGERPVEEGLQDFRHQRHHRWPRRGHLRNRVSWMAFC